MATLIAPTNYDLVQIAEAAGSTDPDARYYQEGIFYVNDVSQTDLNDAYAAYDHDAYLLSFDKSSAKNEIDAAAERARLRHITGGAGQAMAYQEKGEEAADYIAAGYPADLSSYPFIQAEVNATSKTATEAADDIIAQKAAWITVGAQIEEERLRGKNAADSAIDVVAVTVARDSAVSALDLI